MHPQIQDDTAKFDDVVKAAYITNILLNNIGGIPKNVCKLLCSIYIGYQLSS